MPCDPFPSGKTVQPNLLCPAIRRKEERNKDKDIFKGKQDRQKKRNKTESERKKGDGEKKRIRDRVNVKG